MLCTLTPVLSHLDVAVAALVVGWVGGCLGGSTVFNDRTHQVSSTGQIIQLSSDTGEMDISATEHPAGASLEGGVNNFENYYFV